MAVGDGDQMLKAKWKEVHAALQKGDEDSVFFALKLIYDEDEDEDIRAKAREFLRGVRDGQG